MIVVTGATGNVGSALVTRLAAEGHAVRALTRDPGRARTKWPEGVTGVRADFSVPATTAEWEELCAGATSLFLHIGATGGSAEGFVAAAVRAGVRRIVVLSSGAITGDDGEGGANGANDGNDANPIAAHHLPAERAVRSSGAEWTLLRPNAFAVNALAYAPQIRAGDAVRGPYAHAAMAPVHERDIADVAARALLDDGHHGAVHRLTGPEAVTTAGQIELIGAALGRPLRFEEVAEETAAKELYPHMPAPFLRVMLDALAASVDAPPEITTAVEDVTGAKGRTFAQWARDHAEDFR